MKISNSEKASITQELKKILTKSRLEDNFNPKDYILKKTKLLNKYFLEYNIESCSIGISGGIDSAIVLSILNKTNLKNIYPVLMPIKSQGNSNQEEGMKKAIKLCNTLDIKPAVLNLNTPFNSLNKAISQNPSKWEEGQLIPNFRVAAINYFSTLNNSIIIGTTNFSEGSYIGFFGKYSDAMVDIQPISDIYKSEVYKVAEFLNIPKEIISAPPSGDIYNALTDEQMFGVSYDLLEIYLKYLQKSNEEKEYFIDSLNKNSKKAFELTKFNLENFHRYNKHKYLAYSQAIHTDVIFRKIPKGWKYFNYD